MKRLVLLGGGHAHVHVLKTFITEPLRDVSVTLITPQPRQVYSGMLPGWIAGHYDVEDCVIALKPLASAAQVDLLEAAANHIDLTRRQVICTNGAVVDFDVLSIDIGSAANFAGIDGAEHHALAIRPIETFIGHLTALKKRIATDTAGNIVVVGAGAGGVEIALALRHAADQSSGKGTAVTLISAFNTLPGSVGPRILRAIKKSSVVFHAGVAATTIGSDHVLLADGRKIAADFTIVALGAAAAQWPRASGLTCDESGYLLVDQYLQSVSHPKVFAVGDCATMRNIKRPKSGVYAVRAGPPLAENLRRALNDSPLKHYEPQARSLYLISTGSQHAIGSWGPLSWEGDWVWRWKDKIDRAFLGKYRVGESI